MNCLFVLIYLQAGQATEPECMIAIGLVASGSGQVGSVWWFVTMQLLLHCVNSEIIMELSNCNVLKDMLDTGG